MEVVAVVRECTGGVRLQVISSAVSGQVCRDD